MDKLIFIGSPQNKSLLDIKVRSLNKLHPEIKKSKVINDINVIVSGF